MFFPAQGQLPAATTSKSSSLMVEFSEQHGMLPNLKPKKTAIILALRGKGTRAAKREWFPQGRTSIHLPDLQKAIQIAPAYVHLGGIVDPAGAGGSASIIGIAQSAFDSGKSLLYSNVTTPLQIRASMFRMSITSTCFNPALWIRKGRAWEIMERGLQGS